MPTQDITRSIFDFRKQYTGVRMQQGRVLVDDDWNEDAAIDDEDMRRTRVDVIGPAGSPDAGFLIEPLAAPIAAGEPVNFRFLAGTFYLGGHRLELAQPETLRDQSDWLRVSGSLPPRPTAQRDDMVYLEAYEQPVSAAEDAEILEPALGGPDSSTRTRLVCRVSVVPNVATTDCALAWQAAVAAWTAAGEGTVDRKHEVISDARLRVTFVPGVAPSDLCAPVLSGGYLGAENQTIRVELLGGNTLTWGFDNASPLYRVALSNAGGTVTMRTRPRDEMHWPLVDTIVEIIPCGGLLPNRERVAELRGHVAKVTRSYEPAGATFDILPVAPNVVTGSVQPPVPGGQTWGFGEEWKSRADRATLEAEGTYAYLRVWYRGAPVTTSPPLSYTPGAPVTLGNTGIAVTITGTSRRPGDHWIISARPDASPTQIAPWDLATAGGRPGHGVRRWRAPLGIIRWTPGANNTLTAELIHDCRLPFRPLTRLRGCCRYRVGDDLHSYGDFTTIQAAIAALPPEGGEICVLPGEYRERLQIGDRRDVEIHGCGRETRLIAPAAGATPVIAIRDSQDVVIRGMAIVATTTEAIRVEQGANSPAGTTTRIRLENLDIDARDLSAIHVRGGTDIQILQNRITIVELAAPISINSDVGRWAAVTIGADDVRVEGNRVIVLPATSMPRTAFGGIHLLGLSDRIHLRRNVIRGGTGNGVTLGSTVLVPAGTIDPTGGTDAPGMTIVVDGSGCVHVGIIDTTDGTTPYVPVSEGPLSDIRIVENDISEMGANGIGVIMFFTLDGENAQYITVDRLTIARNRIRRCVQLEPLEPTDLQMMDVGHGGIALADGEQVVIRENVVDNNGRSYRDAVCGIFVLRSEGLVIENNHVFDNGPIDGNGGTMVGGVRGGIVVIRALPGSAMGGWDKKYRSYGGSFTPTLRAHDNIVVHPIGRALTVLGLGQMSVQGNQLTSRGTNFPNLLALIIEIIRLVLKQNKTPDEEARLAFLMLELLAGRTVFILNVGFSAEMYAIAGRSATGAPGGSGLFQSSSLAGVGGLFADIARDARGQVEHIVLAGGNVLFTDNQVRLDLLLERQVIALTSSMILSLDQITCSHNQFDCLSPNDFVVADAAAAGWSVSVHGNRMKEFPGRALNSGVTVAVFNNTSDNQGTHCFAISGVPQLLIAAGNRSLVEFFDPEYCSR